MNTWKCQSSGASWSPRSSVTGSTSQEPARCSCCQGPGFAGEIHLLCQWEPTLPSQAVQTNISEYKTRGTLLLKPQNPNKHKKFVLPLLPAHNGSHCGSRRKVKEGKQTVPRTLLLYGSKRDQKKPPKNAANQIQMSQN